MKRIQFSISVLSWDVGEKRPAISDYMSRVREETAPHYDEVHTALFKVAKKNHGKSRI